MIGYWRDPDGKLHEIDDRFVEHIEFAKDRGWLDDYRDDEEPEDNADDWRDDPHWLWTERMKKNLFDKGYIRSRFFQGRNDGDISIQGEPEKITADVIESILEAHKKPKEYPVTIEGPDGREYLYKGTLNDWLLMSNKRFNPNSDVAKIRMNPMYKESSDARVKDVYFPQHIIDAVSRRF